MSLGIELMSLGHILDFAVRSGLMSPLIGTTGAAKTKGMTKPKVDASRRGRGRAKKANQENRMLNIN